MDFDFVSGHLALDFAGTIARLKAAGPVDRLTGPKDLAAWVVAAGLLDTRPRVTRADFAEAVELREAINRLARSLLTGERRAQADRRRVNAAAAQPPVRNRLDQEFRPRRDGDLAAALSTVSRAAIELIGDPADGLRECNAPDCTRLYLDHSRKGDRRWCDMRRCGNRAKAAGFRARQVTS